MSDRNEFSSPGGNSSPRRSSRVASASSSPLNGTRGSFGTPRRLPGYHALVEYYYRTRANGLVKSTRNVSTQTNMHYNQEEDEKFFEKGTNQRYVMVVSESLIYQSKGQIFRKKLLNPLLAFCFIYTGSAPGKIQGGCSQENTD